MQFGEETETDLYYSTPLSTEAELAFSGRAVVQEDSPGSKLGLRVPQLTDAERRRIYDIWDEYCDKYDELRIQTERLVQALRHIAGMLDKNGQPTLEARIAEAALRV